MRAGKEALELAMCALLRMRDQKRQERPAGSLLLPLPASRRSPLRRERWMTT